MSPVQFFLGIDGGGSTCRARIRNLAGAVFAEAKGGASNIYQDFDGAVANIVATARDAADKAGLKVEDLDAGFGLAGMVTSVSAEKLLNAGLPFRSLAVDNDAYVACVGAFNGSDGGIVIAGTGSIGFALIGGTRHIVGGWGFALGDHGSGAWVGHHAVRRVALCIDGLLQPTALLNEIIKTVGNTRQAISRWSEEASPKDYGRFAPLIFDMAKQGDVQAMAIVIEGSAAISKLGHALLSRGAKQLCLLGGLSAVYPPYLDADVKASLVHPQHDAADGAIMMARMNVGLSAKWDC